MGPAAQAGKPARGPCTGHDSKLGLKFANTPPGLAGTMTAPILPCVRTRLLDLVARDPGMNKSDACRELGVAWGTVSAGDTAGNSSLMS